MLPEKYVRTAVENAEKRLEKTNKVLPSKYVTPKTYKYRPEDELSEERVERTYLDGFLEAKGVFLTKADSSPFEHLGLFGKVRNLELGILCQKRAVLGRDQIVDLVEEISASLNPLVSF